MHLCLFISSFTSGHTGVPASVCVCAHSPMVFWDCCATGANRAWYDLCGSLIYLVPVVTLQIDEDNEFDPPSPWCQMVLSSSALLFHPSVQTTSSHHSSRTRFMQPKPCLEHPRRQLLQDAAFHHLGQIHRDFEERHFT